MNKEIHTFFMKKEEIVIFYEWADTFLYYSSDDNANRNPNRKHIRIEQIKLQWEDNKTNTWKFCKVNENSTKLAKN